MRYRALPSAEHVREALEYIPETGQFHWRKSGRPAGHIQTFQKGTTKEHKRRVIRLGDTLYIATRLAWAIMTGAAPDQEIDHRDGDSLNDRWENLRLASHSQNMGNQRRRADNRSGFKGVSWDNFTGRWVARIREPGGRYRNLGRFENAASASRAYMQAAQTLHGEFARA